MTIEQFDKARWGASTKVIYEGNILNVGSVCFQEKLIGVYDINDQSRNNDCNCGQYDWIRCENAELIKPI